jgi:hypothetical protein
LPAGIIGICQENYCWFTPKWQWTAMTIATDESTGLPQKEKARNFSSLLRRTITYIQSKIPCWKLQKIIAGHDVAGFHEFYFIQRQSALMLTSLEAPELANRNGSSPSNRLAVQRTIYLRQMVILKKCEKHSALDTNINL